MIAHYNSLHERAEKEGRSATELGDSVTSVVASRIYKLLFPARDLLQHYFKHESIIDLEKLLELSAVRELDRLIYIPITEYGYLLAGIEHNYGTTVGHEKDLAEKLEEVVKQMNTFVSTKVVEGKLCRNMSNRMNCRIDVVSTLEYGKYDLAKSEMRELCTIFNVLLESFEDDLEKYSGQFVQD